ncbi:hypothetical protein PR202_ga19745 [Eleusine coracana subsp. coracana]|uniref:FBD domain-containing protein n=1 Tax=Eleusine coracana subsp. coracana TaxID=191504 RepID=A0AAV5CUW3_ELECO|nr:hypothetical protein PR202_ga19745 [Eleusine coracana subsp. coracana]
MTNNLTSQETRSDRTHHEAICKTATPSIRFQDLPVKQWMWNNPSKFSSLRHLQLFMHMRPKEFGQFTGYKLWLAELGPRRQELRQCKYHYLKNIRITGFKGARGQVEFLLHVVENAPALEVLTISSIQEASKEFWPYKGIPPFEEAKRIAITSLTAALPQNVGFYVIYLCCMYLSLRMDGRVWDSVVGYPPWQAFVVQLPPVKGMCDPALLTGWTGGSFRADQQVEFGEVLWVILILVVSSPVLTLCSRKRRGDHLAKLSPACSSESGAMPARKFTGYHLWLAKVGPRRQELGRCEYFYLKNIHISGFKGAREQVEFLLHVVENAPALEVLTVNTTEEAAGDYWPYNGSPPFEEAKRIAITSLTVALPQNVKFYVI